MGDVPRLEQVRGLEDLLVRHAVLLGGGQEGLDILHQQEGGTLLFELLDAVRLDLVHQATEDNSVLENLRKVSLGELLVKDSFNPLRVILLFIVSLLYEE